MLKDHYQNTPNDPPTAQSLILAEADALLSFWPDVRNDDSLGPDEAINLLSVWGHLRRFVPTSLEGELTSRFNRLIDDELETVCEKAMAIQFPSDWLDTSVQLEEAWDHVTDDDSIYEIERCIRGQFKILDRSSLTAYSLEKLLPSIVSHQGFKALKSSIGAAEEFLADNPDMFLSAAVFASAMLDSYRADLDAFDEELAETTLKHRILQELIDEQQAPSKPVAIPSVVAEELVRRFTEKTVCSQPVRYEPTTSENFKVREQPGRTTVDALKRRKNAIVAEDDSYALAANTPASGVKFNDGLGDRRIEIEGTLGFEVMLDLVKASTVALLLTFQIRDKMGSFGPYVSAELRTSSGEISKGLSHGRVSFELKPDEINDDLFLMFLDADGNRYRVNLGST